MVTGIDLGRSTMKGEEKERERRDEDAKKPAGNNDNRRAGDDPTYMDGPKLSFCPLNGYTLFAG